MWCPGSGMVLDDIDSLSLPPLLLSEVEVCSFVCFSSPEPKAQGELL